MKLKTLAVAAALALGATGSAYAADIVHDAGMIPVAPDTFYHLFDHDTIGTFTDTINFSITAGDLASSANPLNVMLSGTNVSNIDDLQYTLWSGSTSLFTYDGNNSTNMSMALPAGDYVIKVTGNANGTHGGTYGMAMSLVPEPETYAMLLAGLGLVGFASRRRPENEKFSA
ncbi:MAG TPA: FxDxF family PEP-CTERM protein [Telluria sp.]|nr:FxDxF family PEP-CTERM protein [Telluria sp.]